MKTNNFRGDLTDNSSKKEALHITRLTVQVQVHLNTSDGSVTDRIVDLHSIRVIRSQLITETIIFPGDMTGKSIEY